MLETLEVVSELVALGAEFVAALLIAIGGLHAAISIAPELVRGRPQGRAIKTVWLGLAGWIVLALEFELAADIVRTAIAPTWDDIGKLAAIAAIRTALSLYLERDLISLERSRGTVPPVTP